MCVRECVFVCVCVLGWGKGRGGGGLLGSAFIKLAVLTFGQPPGSQILPLDVKLLVQLEHVCR